MSESTTELPRRSLLMLAMGAGSGLLLAGYALFTAPGSTTDKIPRGVIALVNQRQILLSDYLTQLEGLYGVAPGMASAEQRRAVLDSMLAEELLVQRGLEIDLAATDPAVREALVAGVELASAADIETRKWTNEELKTWFDTHRSQYVSNGSMLVHDLVLPAAAGQPAQASLDIVEQAAQALRRSMGLGAVCKRFGLKDSSKPAAGEQSDLVVARTLGADLFAVARSLAEGQVSGPMVRPDGVHLLAMERRHPETPLGFEAVQDRVASDLKREAINKARAEYVRFLRAKAEVKLAPGYAE